MHRPLRARAVATLVLSAILPCIGVTAQAARPGDGNTPPEISGTPPTAAEVTQLYIFRPVATDVNGDPLRFKVQGRPAWASFDSTSGTLYGTPSADAVGTYSNIVIAVTDGQRGKAWVALPAFSITVKAGTNSPPQLVGVPPPMAMAESTYDFVPAASDADGDPLSFSISNKPAWASFSASTGQLRGMPAKTDVGVYSNIVIQASDGTNSTALPAFTVTVETVANQPPVIGGTPSTGATVGQAYAFQPTASDPEGQPLTFSIVNRPAWASFSSATGRLSGTPAAGDVGASGSIVISVSDGSALASLPAFALTVAAAPNTAPTISGSPASSVTTGQAYAFTPTASDPDAGQTLRFGIANRPAWASFDVVTGRLAGTPATGDAGTWGNIVVSVSDGIASATLPAFAITVNAANRAPTLSGSPSTSATVGQPYAFRPTASDPDGDRLTFSIANRPSWASFDTSTGQLSGTPSSSQVGAYSGITISASDGTASASLAPFSITVADVQLGSATLSWTPPTLNEDGTPLTDLRGYRIYYGTNSSSLGTILEIPNPGIATAVVENLARGTWYFAVKAYNASNVESSLSNLASKTIL
jgi:hypothetical protein